MYRTIVSKLSAIIYVHRCYNLSESNENVLVQKSLLGIGDLSTVPDSKMPIFFVFITQTVFIMLSHVYIIIDTSHFPVDVPSGIFSFIRVAKLTLSNGRKNIYITIQICVFQTK